MAARRLVLNGLTAEVGGAPLGPPDGPPDGDGSPDSLEFYHELELYRQLLALPPAGPPSAGLPPAGPPSAGLPPAAPPSAGLPPAGPPFGGLPPADPQRRARTPDPPQAPRFHGEPRRSRTPGDRAAPAAARRARYLGSFPVPGGEPAARSDAVSAHLHLMKENGQAVPVLVVVALSGVKVCDPDDQSVRMHHALRRISYATCEAARALFALVAREPRSEPPHHFCHAFHTDTPQQAEELNSLVGDAFRMAFASQLQPSAPLWSKELSGSDCGMGVRAPDTLPGLTHHYPHCGDRSPVKCDRMGITKLVNEPSPSSSEESNSPTEINCYRRLGERPPLMKRLAMGLSGALLQPSDDDSTPLVADTPTTPTNLPLCLNGGYINEASEAEQRTRESNREPPTIPCMPTMPSVPSVPTMPSVPTAPRRTEHLLHGDLDVDFRRCNNLKNSESAACSRTTSSSSGASSCGGPPANNNVPRAEPELRQAPWFQHGIPREIALEVLGSQPVGAFLVRGSTTQAGCYALSVRVPRDFTPAGIAHYLILRTPKGYKIKGFTKEFSSLCALVTHHSVMPELLPVPLRLARAGRPAPARRDHADLDALHAPLAPHAPHTPRHAPHTPRHAPHHAPIHPHHFLAQPHV